MRRLMRQIEFRSAFFQQWHTHEQGAGCPLVGYRRLNLEEVRSFEELERGWEAVRVQAHATIGTDDQHVADLRNLARDAAAFQLRQIVPVRPDAGGLFDVAQCEVLDGVAQARCR